jgi:UDP-glucose 4-epimerase
MVGEEDLRSLPVPDHVINLHWWVDRDRPFAEQVTNEIRWNVSGPEFLWRWLREGGVKSFVNSSSIRVFSGLNENPISSRTEPRPLSPYGIAKVAGEKFFTAFFHETATRVAHLRLCSVSSHGEHPSQLMSRLVAGTVGGERIRLNTGHTANVIYIDEVVDILISAAISDEAGRFVIATPERSIDEIARVFETVCGQPVNAEYVDLAPGIPDARFNSDIDTFRADWVRVTPLESAMGKILEQHRSERE